MSKDYSNLEGLIGNVKESIRNAYDKGYKQGRKDAEKEARKKEYWEQGYNEGLKDAWTCCRDMEQILFDVDNNKFSEIFGAPDFHSALTHFDVEKCIQKIKEYEEKKKADSEIKVGDEVYIIMENYPSVVTCVFSENGLDNPKAVHITGSGRYAVTLCNQLHKTGRHFDCIAEVLEQLKGEI